MSECQLILAAAFRELELLMILRGDGFEHRDELGGVIGGDDVLTAFLVLLQQRKYLALRVQQVLLDITHHV